MIHIFLGDSVSVPVPLAFGGAPFVPGEEWHLIATAKASPAHPDARAVIQKSTGAGITTAGSTATLDIVPSDTVELAAGRLFWDIQAQRIASPNEVRTVAFFDMLLVRDITRETTTSVPVYTTNPPFPGGITSIDGLIEAGDNITISGDGTTASPYVVALSSTISVSSLTTAATVYGNNAAFTYGTSSASNHRTALGLGSFATLENNGTANLSVALLSASSGQVGGNLSVSGDITSTKIDAVAIGASNIVTEADNFTVSEATHAGRYIRLTKSSAEQQITWPATGIATGREFFFFRATDRAITFAGSGVVTGASRLADVVENSGFGVKCTGVGTYDLL